MTSLLDMLGFSAGDEACRIVASARKPVTSLKFLQVLKDKLETPYGVSGFFKRLLTVHFAARPRNESPIAVSI
jgi:hypothetical protein